MEIWRGQIGTFYRPKTCVYICVCTLSGMSSDWYPNLDWLKESCRVATSYNWADVDLSPFQGNTPPHNMHTEVQMRTHTHALLKLSVWTATEMNINKVIYSSLFPHSEDWTSACDADQFLWLNHYDSSLLALEVEYYNIQCHNSLGLIKVIILHLRGCPSLSQSLSHSFPHPHTHTCPPPTNDVNNPIRPQLSNSLLSRSAHKAGKHPHTMDDNGWSHNTQGPGCLCLPSVLDLPHAVTLSHWHLYLWITSKDDLSHSALSPLDTSLVD